ncbi:hypothetical protein [Lactobacillus hominis]|uniref:Uncharacterized protein n=1 Tax=Lactobacillus hominis DSM 23910 = CRBIP 24.179 TaxID=1423758 RepID=I7KHY8_9LACO|nr:hypothetical protein [Lactobacillus hominis]KRM85173.1 hypothetical protein FC41_GL001553 [Lactobacillus hominis DSM 23910 = CRBIP 24.179]MCT3348335.1 hypothetical protein [Lactobacillus hominis]CCI82535.1 Putative uncharacterized protein [Lactobacillus hominis DSM 23910 = CRBIP 24.179]
MQNSSKGLKNLVKLMRGEQVTGDKYFDYAQEKILKINQDPQRRVQIMDYETKLLEREQFGERVATEFDLKNSLKRYIDLGLSKSQILNILLEDYSDTLGEEEVKLLVNKAL